MKNSKFLLFSVLCIFISVVRAGVPYTSTPSCPPTIASASIPGHVLSYVDLEGLLQPSEDSLFLIYGYKKICDIDFIENARVDTTINGDTIRRFSFESSDAYSLQLYCDNFNIPPGAELYIYNTDKSMILGPFTNNDNRRHKRFATDVVSGDKFTLEYIEPKSAEFRGQIHVSGIGHSVLDIITTGNPVSTFGQSQGCHKDITCSEGDGWGDQIRSVVVIKAVTYNGVEISFTGNLVNNTSNDRTPLLLTCFHGIDTDQFPVDYVNTPYTEDCILSAEEKYLAYEWIFTFNYYLEECANINTATVGESTWGADVLAWDAQTDYLLVKLTSIIPPDFKAFLSGWDKRGFAPMNGLTMIHHPNGDYKKITIDAPVSSGLSDNSFLIPWKHKACTSNVYTHWVMQWDIGAQEGGSSGSGIYDSQSKLIIGQMHGGPNNCSYQYLNGYAGKFSEFMGNSALARQYLDPLNSGAVTLEGINYNECNDLIEIDKVLTNSNVKPNKGVYTDFERGMIISVESCKSQINQLTVYAKNLHRWTFDISGSNVLPQYEVHSSQIVNSPNSLDFEPYQIWDGYGNNTYSAPKQFVDGLYPFVFVGYDNCGGNKVISGYLDVSKKNNCNLNIFISTRSDMFGSDMLRLADTAEMFMERNICKKDLLYNSMIAPLYLHRDEYYDFVDHPTPFLSAFKKVNQKNKVFYRDAFLGPKRIVVSTSPSFTGELPESAKQDGVLEPVAKLQPRHLKQMKHLLTMLVDSSKSNVVRAGFYKVLCASDAWLGLTLKESLLQIDKVLASEACIVDSGKVLLCHTQMDSISQVYSSYVDTSEVQEHIAHGDYLGSCVCSGEYAQNIRVRGCQAPDLLTPIETSIKYHENLIRINYYLYNPSKVVINLINRSNGELVQVLDDANREESSNYILLNSSDYSNGDYLIQFVVNGKVIKTETFVINQNTQTN